MQLYLSQTLADEQDAINQQPIRRALDLEIPKERVGAEQRQDLVHGIVRFRVGIGRDREREGRVDRECVGWATGLGA